MLNIMYVFTRDCARWNSQHLLKHTNGEFCLSHRMLVRKGDSINVDLATKIDLNKGYIFLSEHKLLFDSRELGIRI